MPAAGCSRARKGSLRTVNAFLAMQQASSNIRTNVQSQLRGYAQAPARHLPAACQGQATARLRRETSVRSLPLKATYRHPCSPNPPGTEGSCTGTKRQVPTSFHSPLRKENKKGQKAENPMCEEQLHVEGGEVRVRNQMNTHRVSHLRH